MGGGPANASGLLGWGGRGSTRQRVAPYYLLAVPMGRSQRAGQIQSGVRQGRREGKCRGHSEGWRFPQEWFSARWAMRSVALCSAALFSRGQGQGGRDWEQRPVRRERGYCCHFHTFSTPLSPQFPTSDSPFPKAMLASHAHYTPTCAHVCGGFPTTYVQSITWTLAQSLLLIPFLKAQSTCYLLPHCLPPTKAGPAL